MAMHDDFLLQARAPLGRKQAAGLLGSVATCFERNGQDSTGSVGFEATRRDAPMHFSRRSFSACRSTPQKS